MCASPDAVELFHDFFDEFRLGCNKSGFEISAIVTFGSHSGTCEVAAAGVGEEAVDDDRLEVDARAENSFHAGDQIGIAVEIGSEGRSRFFGME